MENPHDYEVPLPLTEGAFESMLELACDYVKTPVTDELRQVLAGFIHHIPNEENMVKMDRVLRMVHKATSNHMSWGIDQKIKAKKRAEEQEKQKLSVVPEPDNAS